MNILLKESLLKESGLRNINKSPIVKLTGYTAKLVLRDVSFELWSVDVILLFIVSFSNILGKDS